MKRTCTLLTSLMLACMLMFSAVAFADVEYPVATNHQTYPLVDEPLELTIWYPHAGSMGELADFNDAEFFQWYEKKTGIHMNFEVPAVNAEADAFQLLFVSDEMPDIILNHPGSYGYRGGEDKAIEDGYFVDMAEYLDLCPNYVEWLENNPSFKRAAYSDTGKMYGLWGVFLPMYPELGVMADQGLAIRKDFLDKVGLDVPVTYDDWYVMLKAFKDQLGIQAPLYLTKYGIDVTGDFMAGFDTAPYFYQVDGEVKYGPLDDNYRDYLQMLHQWWEEGLLDRDFATRTTSFCSADKDMMLNDRVGSCVDYGTRLSETYITRGASNPDFYMIGVTQPVKKVGDVPAYRDFAAGNDLMNTYCWCINAESKHVEEAIRWVDGWYAKDVYLNANYGMDDQEGVVWFADEKDGHRIGNYDFRFHNPNGTSSATVVVKYWTKSQPARCEAAQIEQSDQNKQDGWKAWSTYAPTRWISNRTTMTSEEGTEFATMYTDIETYVQECNVKFIMGQMSLDDYDAYRDTLRSMGIERCMELKQIALDRYNAR